jgi:hypothetical protein
LKIFIFDLWPGFKRNCTIFNFYDRANWNLHSFTFPMIYDIANLGSRAYHLHYCTGKQNYLLSNILRFALKTCCWKNNCKKKKIGSHDMKQTDSSIIIVRNVCVLTSGSMIVYRNLQIRVHVYRPRHYCGDWLTFSCFVPMIADHDLVTKR